ncbi:unnamed protein product [Paramecium pentaurelia]|uniref:Uncharacterized protein n=1 Tax=Paramecium pentaurelia TaxID=43138 RepID=A0A8S1VF19_9CILI|nr:unnamed protein product [Paramecium pentaurelia]
MFSFASSTDLKLKKVHLQKATAKGDWGKEKSKVTGKYYPTNSYCINQCTAAGGQNCGTSKIVCCDSRLCFDNEECIEELYIDGCDS